MASTISKAASGRGSLSIRLRRDSYPLLFIMTSVGGFCASYSFLARGGVFAFAQTGNIIYSGHVMASGHFLGVLTFLFPILSYMLGLFLSQQLRDRQADLVTFEKIILLFQSLLMTLSALMPDSFAATRLVLCLLGLSSGLQMQTFHRVEGHEYTSIMVMGNMKRTVEAFSAYLKDHETWIPQKSPALHLHQQHLLSGLCLGLCHHKSHGRLGHYRSGPVSFVRCPHTKRVRIA